MYDKEDIELTRRDCEDRIDNDQLARLGKKAVLNRNFSYMSILGFSCTILITWEGTGALFLEGLHNGGPAGVIYSFLIVWFGNLSLFSTLSELVSMAPTSGGQYHWVAMLAPRSCAKFLSYLTGWITAAGWLGTVASAGYLSGSMLQVVVALTTPGYHPEPYQALLMFWAFLAFALAINTVLSFLLPKFEALILVLHVLGFVAVLVVLVTLGPRNDAQFLFTTFNNGGKWPTQGLSFFVGMMGNVFAFVGADAAFHMSEEIHNPSIVVPRSLMFSLVINGATGFAMLLALLYCVDDFATIQHPQTGFTFIDIYLKVTNSIPGAVIMTCITVILAACATVGVLASASRIIWAFSRDRGIPGWQIFSKVHSRNAIPIYAVLLSTAIVSILGCITIGSVVAFNGVISLSVSGLYSSYLIATCLLLYRRCTSGFTMPDLKNPMPALANTTGAELTWGPWRVPGKWGIVNNIVACIYVIIIWFFSFWPTQSHVSRETMNFSSVVTGAVAIFSILYYLIWARRVYEGPIIEVK